MLLALAVVSTLLLPVMEVEAVTDEYAYADRIFGDAARWLRSSPFVPVLLALGFATGFIHYLLDRAAFRFSSPDVRQAARGLLQSRRFGLSEPLGLLTRTSLSHDDSAPYGADHAKACARHAENGSNGLYEPLAPSGNMHLGEAIECELKSH